MASSFTIISVKVEIFTPLPDRPSCAFDENLTWLDFDEATNIIWSLWFIDSTVDSATGQPAHYWRLWSRICIVRNPSSWTRAGTSEPSSSPARRSCNSSAATCPRIRISPARSGSGSAGPSAVEALATCAQELASWPAAARARARALRRAAFFGPLL